MRDLNKLKTLYEESYIHKLYEVALSSDLVKTNDVIICLESLNSFIARSRYTSTVYVKLFFVLKRNNLNSTIIVRAMDLLDRKYYLILTKTEKGSEIGKVTCSTVNRALEEVRLLLKRSRRELNYQELKNRTLEILTIELNDKLREYGGKVVEIDRTLDQNNKKCYVIFIDGCKMNPKNFEESCGIKLQSNKSLDSFKILDVSKKGELNLSEMQNLFQIVNITGKREKMMERLNAL